MVIDSSPKPFPFLLIRDFYSKEEQQAIWFELNYLTNPKTMQSGAYIGVTGELDKKAHGVFLENFFPKSHHSAILSLSKKAMTQQIYDEMTKLNFGYESINCVNESGTLVSYYEDADYYRPHRDESAFTGLTWFFKEPKNFTGGDLTFTDYDYTIHIEPNMFVLFPSFVRHEVSDIKMDAVKKFTGLGRYCISQFYYIVPTVYKEIFRKDK